MRHEERERCFFRVTKLQTNNKFVTYIELEACPVEREIKIISIIKDVMQVIMDSNHTCQYLVSERLLADLYDTTILNKLTKI